MRKLLFSKYEKKVVKLVIISLLRAKNYWHRRSFTIVLSLLRKFLECKAVAMTNLRLLWAIRRGGTCGWDRIFSPFMRREGLLYCNTLLPLTLQNGKTQWELFCGLLLSFIWRWFLPANEKKWEKAWDKIW